MKTKLLAFSRSYHLALARHLRSGPETSLQAARKLGVRALKLDLETLALARIHETALLAFVSPARAMPLSDAMIRRAGVFFTEAITPIEETHRGARNDYAQLKAMIEKLGRRSLELAESNKGLKQEIVQRKASEASLRISETTTSKLLEKSLHQQEELRFLSRQLLSVQEDERKRISRELHDVVAQTLAGINLQLAALTSQTANNTKDLHQKIAITQKLVIESVDIVHRFARDLRPAVLDDFGLIPALQSYVTGFMEQTGLPVAFKAFPGVEEQDSACRIVLYRVVQEALTNVARHAKARRVSIKIHNKSDAVHMEIYDNGKGFRVNGVKSGNRLGLLGMRERVEMIGGTFGVDSIPGQSTTIRVEIPHEIPCPTPKGRSKSPRSPQK